MLRYLAERGISPGERFSVRERQPFGGPLFVRFGEKRREHAIGGRLAAAMRVIADPRVQGAAGAADEIEGRR
jgi:DtxR family Mn-dependent transcriptional regulator